MPDISPISPPHLPYISPISPLYLHLVDDIRLGERELSPSLVGAWVAAQHVQPDRRRRGELGEDGESDEDARGLVDREEPLGVVPPRDDLGGAASREVDLASGRVGVRVRGRGLGLGLEVRDRVRVRA